MIMHLTYSRVADYAIGLFLLDSLCVSNKVQQWSRGQGAMALGSLNIYLREKCKVAFMVWHSVVSSIYYFYLQTADIT